METQKIVIDIPDHVLGAMQKTREELIRQMKILTAVHLYLSNELSLEMAAEFAGKPKWDFEDLLAKNEIPISLINFDDYRKELDIISTL
jgi:predicted HTH domain antitoxin